MTLQSGIRVLVIGRYPQERGAIRGGVEAVTSTLCPAIASVSDVEQVVVLAFERGRTSSVDEEHGPGLRVIRAPRQRRFEVPTRGYTDARVVRSVVRRFGIDLVHAQGIGIEGDLALQSGCPTVATVHGIAELEQSWWHRQNVPNRVRRWLLARQIRRVLGNADAIISISQYDRRHYRAFIGGASHQIPNPVAPLFFESYRDLYDGTAILYAGWIQALKNVDGIIRAYRRLQQRGLSPQLLLAGPMAEPAYAESLRQTIAENGLAAFVHLLGHQNWPSLVELMQTCGVVTLFSHQENLPTVLSQAMAMGRPVVASNVGGVPELIQEDVNGYLVPPGDEEALAQRWETVLSSAEIRRRLGAAGRVLALERFSVTQVAQKTVDVYGSVLRGRKRAAYASSPEQDLPA